MAKLNVVILSVDVEVSGVKYRKVERKAVAGDIVKVLSVNYDLTRGAFYPVIDGALVVGEPTVIDDVNDEVYPFDMYPKDFEVYEKVTEAPTKYREVKRKANVGELVRVFGHYMEKQNTEHMVTRVESSGHVYYVGGGRRPDGYVVLEPITEPTQPERLKVGEYAKVIDTDGSSCAVLGDIVKVTKVDCDDTSKYGDFISVETSSGKKYNMFGHRFIRATDAEVAAAKQTLERTKAIGEFTEGGYAVVVDATLDVNATRTGINGNYVTVAIAPSGGTYMLKLTNPDGKLGGYCNADALRKITQEEYEAAIAELTKSAPKFEVGEKVRLISGGGNRYVPNLTNGDILVIDRTTDCDGDYRVKRVPGGDIGYVQAEQLEKVSAEEVAKLTEEAQWNAIGRKVGEYKAGDVVEVVARGGSGYNEGLVDYVTDDRGIFGVALYLSTGVAGKNPYIGPSGVKLIAPVESLFNASTAGGERK